MDSYLFPSFPGSRDLSPAVAREGSYDRITLQDYPRELLINDQRKCPELAPAIKAITKKKKPVCKNERDKHSTMWNCSNGTMLEDTLVKYATDGYYRKIVPKCSRGHLLRLAHDVRGHHYNAKQMMHRLENYTWKGMPLAVDKFITNCECCRIEKFNKEVREQERTKKKSRSKSVYNPLPPTL